MNSEEAQCIYEDAFTASPKHSMSRIQFLSDEEEDSLSATYFTSSESPQKNILSDKTCVRVEQSSEPTVDDHMRDLEESFHQACAVMGTSQAMPTSNCLHSAYAEVHMPASEDLVQRLRLAMHDIPEGTKGLEDCKKYFTNKQFYTMLDVLVAQYVLNDGLLMRQHHNQDDEFHVDISEPLLNTGCTCDGHEGSSDSSDSESSEQSE